MASLRSPATAPAREWKWSPAEKAVARRAIDLSLSRELKKVMQNANRFAFGHRCSNHKAIINKWPLPYIFAETVNVTERVSSRYKA